MRLPRNRDLKGFSQALRVNATVEEKKLWYEYLRNYPIHWYRQKIIENFILDFYCPHIKLAIELDGGQHYEDVKALKDHNRNKRLKELGIVTLRFTNDEVNNNFDQVCIEIDFQVKALLKTKDEPCSMG